MEYDANIIKKLEEWATNQPMPNEPLLIISDKQAYTPMQILEQVRQKTELGLVIYEGFAKEELEFLHSP